jgi:hypothetical protein
VWSETTCAGFQGTGFADPTEPEQVQDAADNNQQKARADTSVTANSPAYAVRSRCMPSRAQVRAGLATGSPRRSNSANAGAQLENIFLRQATWSLEMQPPVRLTKTLGRSARGLSWRERMWTIPFVLWACSVVGWSCGVPGVNIIQTVYESEAASGASRHDKGLKVLEAKCDNEDGGRFLCQVMFLSVDDPTERLYFDIVAVARKGQGWELKSGLCKR